MSKVFTAADGQDILDLHSKIILVHPNPSSVGMTMTNTRLFLLKASDEVATSYQAALDIFGGPLVCFSKIEELIHAAEGQPPLAVIVDLDAIEKVQTVVLEQIRAAFATSELIALSSKDSSQVALLCLRSGFSDFLLKPTSPEELTWSLRKCLQKRELGLRPGSPKTQVLHALNDLATSTSPAVLRLNALRYVKRLFAAKGASWIAGDSDEPKILCSLPKSPTGTTDVLKRWTAGKRHRAVFANQTTGRRSVYLHCQNPTFGGIVVWGIEAKVKVAGLLEAEALLEHAEVNLMNLLKLAEIRRQTFIDDLTGLYNSRYLKFALQTAVNECRPGHSFAVLFIDVDRFKAVNDLHGHQVGSDLLVALARTIKNSVRGADAVFRYGGDEFIVVLQNASLEKSKEIAERLRRHIERRLFIVRQQSLKTTVSIGLAVYPLHAGNQDTLLQLADQAMYSAKRQSRNSVHLAVIPEIKPVLPPRPEAEL